MKNAHGKGLLATLLVALIATGCIQMPENFSGLPPGVWRATLNLASGPAVGDEAFDEKTNGLLPFNFEVVYPNRDSFYIVIINGEERIILDDIVMAWDRRLGKDTLRIDIPYYDSYIHARYEEDAIEGDWYVPNRGENYKIPFRALHSKDYRFGMIEAPDFDASGRWHVRFNPDQPNEFDAIGVFEQDRDGLLNGTFMRSTGDYRYLEGKVSEDRLFMSVFDGSHAYLFEAKLLADGSLAGIYRSGNHYKVYWTATRNDDVGLDDPYEMSEIVDAQLDSLLNLTDYLGNQIDLTAPPYAGKPLIFQVMGTWCPNCRDETEFLIEYQKNNPDKDFNIVAFSFERYEDEAKARKAIAKYIDHFNIKYPVVHVGGNSKALASRTIPNLSGILAFPTLIFIDNNNRIVKVHSGFNGPATDKYETFQRDFDRTITLLINS